MVSSALVLVAASCSDEDPDTASSVVEIAPSAYEVQELATTTAAPVDTTPTADGRSPVEQAYIVQEGDYPVIIAELYDVDIDELRNYNGWASDYSDFPQAGGTVRIPPNAKFIDPNATTTSTAEEEDDEATESTDEGEETGTTAEGDCEPAGSYVIEEGDNPTLIAEKFDVTLEALTSANGWASDYSDFPNVGASIVIPGEDC